MPRLADPLAKAKLLRAARAVFARDGLADARVEDVARAAGVAKGSFYLHFRSKDEAFFQIVDAFLAALAHEVDECRADLREVRTAADVRRVLRDLDGQMLAFLWAQRDVVRMIHGCDVPRYAHIVDGFMDAQSAQIADNVRMLQARGVYKKGVDPLAAAWIIAGGWHNLSRRLARLREKPDFGRWVGAMHALFLDGLVRR